MLSNQIVNRTVGEMFKDPEIMLFKLLTLRKVLTLFLFIYFLRE